MWMNADKWDGGCKYYIFFADILHGWSHTHSSALWPVYFSSCGIILSHRAESGCVSRV